MLKQRRFWMYLGLNGVMILASLPLTFRLVPPNRWYGFRLPGALIDPKLWYEVNAMGGKLFITAMVVCAVVNVVLFWQAREIAARWAGWINAVLILVSFWLVSVELVSYLPH